MPDFRHVKWISADDTAAFLRMSKTQLSELVKMGFFKVRGKGPSAQFSKKQIDKIKSKMQESFEDLLSRKETYELFTDLTRCTYALSSALSGIKNNKLNWDRIKSLDREMNRLALKVRALFDPDKVSTWAVRPVESKIQSAPLALAPIRNLRRDEDVKSYVYFLVRQSKIVYIGQTVGLRSRVLSHRKDKDFDDVYFLEIEAHELNEVENVFIHYFKPQYNLTRPWSPKRQREIFRKYGADHLLARDYSETGMEIKVKSSEGENTWAN